MSDDQLNKHIERLWYKLANGIQVNIMSIPKIFKEAKNRYRQGEDLEMTVMPSLINKYRLN